MNVDERDIANCLQHAREVAEQYRLYVLAADQPQRSVEDLLWICRQYLGKSILVRDLELPAQSRDVAGCYMAHSDGTYRIFLLSGLDPVMRRFVLCKELFHVILDEERCRTTDIRAHLEEVSSTFHVADSEPNCAAVWEAMAEAAAMEFLLPFADRLSMKKAAGEVDIPVVASRYGIPERYVESYCSDLMMDVFAEFEPAVVEASVVPG